MKLGTPLQSGHIKWGTPDKRTKDRLTVKSVSAGAKVPH